MSCCGADAARQEPLDAGSDGTDRTTCTMQQQLEFGSDRTNVAVKIISSTFGTSFLRQ
jgi:hypothetical protein